VARDHPAERLDPHRDHHSAWGSGRHRHAGDPPVTYLPSAMDRRGDRDQRLSRIQALLMNMSQGQR
jgi:hypothetical protein